jgi:DNA-binding NarL/FixJ family response regulator
MAHMEDKSLIRLLLVDEQTTFRQLFAMAMERGGEFTVVAEVDSIEVAKRCAPSADIALVGLTSDTAYSAKLVRELRTANPSLIQVAIANNTQPRKTAFAIEMGAAVVLSRAVGLVELVNTLRRASKGERLMSSDEMIAWLKIASQTREIRDQAQASLATLTKRETEILRILALGLSDTEIAERLNIGTETVRTHITHLLYKLNLRTRIQAVVFAVQSGCAVIDRF